MMKIFKRRMKDNEVRAVAAMQKEIDTDEHAIDLMTLMLSDLPVTFPDYGHDHDHLKYVISMVRRTLKDNDHFRDQVKDLTSQLMEARRELARLTTKAGDPNPDQS